MSVPAKLAYIALLIADLLSAWLARQLSSPDRQGGPYLYAVSREFGAGFYHRTGSP